MGNADGREVGEELTDDEVREDARAAALAARAARKPAQIKTQGAADDPAQIVTRQAGAMVHRMTGGELPAESREFVNMSLMDIARDNLSRSGVSVRGMGADDVLQRAAHGTSDFSLVVSNAMGKVALDAYQAAQSPLKTLSRQRTLSNFKASTSIRLGGMGRLEALTEQGEFTATSRAEHGKSMKLATMGRRIDVTRQLIIDDDLNLMGDIVSALGQAAAQTEADLMVDLIVSNPNLSDGNPVFHGSRDNVACRYRIWTWQASPPHARSCAVAPIWTADFDQRCAEASASRNRARNPSGTTAGCDLCGNGGRR